MDSIAQGEGLRLSVHQYEALLDGHPGQLRTLADELEKTDDVVTLPLAVPPMTLRRRRNESPRLKISVGPGPSLLIEGNDQAIHIVAKALRGAADMAQDAHAPRHVHIEYLGEDDPFRSPDSFPLVVGSDWPAD